MSGQMILRRLLEQSGGSTQEASFFLVMDSEGLEELPATLTTGSTNWAVCRPQTEIGLRHALWKANQAPLIAVVGPDLANRLPADLLRRARNQRVHSMGMTDALSTILGIRVVGIENASLERLAFENARPLAESLHRRTVPSVVDNRLLQELLLEILVDASFVRTPPAHLLAQWVLEPPMWPVDVRELVVSALPREHGDEGRLLAWALKNDELESLLVHGILLAIEEVELPQKAWGALWEAAPRDPIELERTWARKVAGRLAEGAVERLGEAASIWLEKANAIGRRVLTPGVLKQSRLLPLAFWGQLDELAKRAAKGETIGASELAWVRGHRAAIQGQAELEVLDAMVRLIRYLDTEACASPEALMHVEAYQRDGAFADLAAAQLSRALAGTSRFHAESRAVLTAYRTRRNQENEAFANRLTAGYEAALHQSGLTPLHRLWKRVVAPVAGNAPLFVVVMDGLSYPLFLELANTLAQDAAFPIGLSGAGMTRVAGLPALAPLPTVTSHARGALFLGELPQDPLVAETVFREQAEAKTDKARFNQNPHLGERTRKLFLKGDLGDGGQALLEAIRDSAISIVAVVFNAVDDQIGSSNTGSRVRIRPEEIMAFRPSLQEALRAGRRVLLTADHGHTPFIDKSLRIGAGATPRYLELEPGADAPEGYSEIDVAGLGGLPARRAFAWKMGAYAGNPQVGFHGGCGLEEMVVPLAWLERDGLAPDEPSWWYGGAVEPIPRVEAPPPPQPETLPSPRLVQATLFDSGGTAAARGVPESVLAILTNEEKALLDLLAQNGTARTSELADHMKRSPARLNGQLVLLRRKLSDAGASCVQSEVLPTGETLYRFRAPGGRS